MNYRKALKLLGCGAALLTVLSATQRPFRVYPSMEAYDDVALPEDWQEQTEWIFARLMYPQHPHARFGGFRYGRWSDLAGRRHQLDAGLSACGPALRSGPSPAEQSAGPVG